MQPNVIFCVIDALRVDRIGEYGGRPLTPNIDAFADDAAVFTRAYSTTNTTDPAITSLQTGLYPLSHGVINHGWRVTSEEKRRVESHEPLPELLKDLGYRTAKFGRPLGRWHKRGFDIYPEVGEWREPKDTSTFVNLKTGLGAQLEQIDPRLEQAAAWIYGQTCERFSDWLMSSPMKAEIGRADVIGELREFLPGNDPFYAFVHLMDTHVPYQVDSAYTDDCLTRFEYENEPLEQVKEKFPEGSFSHDRLRPGGRIYDTAEPWRDAVYGLGTAVVDAQYDASVRKADERVGQILSLLEERDVLDDTFVVLLADHGESLTEHGIYYDHHGLYEPSVHIPIMVRPPGGTEGRRFDDFVQITDVMPTVADYTGIDISYSLDGVSLRPVLEDGESTNRTTVIAEEAHTQRRRMIRTADEKFIYLVEGDTTCRYCEIEHAPESEYYSLADDPAERRDRFDSNRDRADALRHIADEFAAKLVSRSGDLGANRVIHYDDEAEIFDRLEALGYK